MIKSSKYNAQDLFSKIDWEGGVYETLTYGLAPEDIDDSELSHKWGELKMALMPVDFMADEFVKLLEQKADAEWEAEQEKLAVV